MDYALGLGCRHETNMTTTTTIENTHTYWTATALEVSPAAMQQDEDKDAEHYKHKFGLCNECGHGLDDESDFVLHPMTGGDTLILCIECWIHPCPWGSKKQEADAEAATEEEDDHLQTRDEWDNTDWEQKEREDWTESLHSYLSSRRGM